MMSYPFAVTLTAAMVSFMKQDLDPTYFFYRNIFSGSSLNLVRITINCVLTFHSALVFIDFIITMVNVVGATLACFKKMLVPKLFQQRCETKFQNNDNFYKFFLKYRQLSITTTVGNQIFYYILPAVLFIWLVLGCVSVYLVIKLSPQLPLVLSLFAGLLIILVGIVANGIVPMFAKEDRESERFLYLWKLNAHSAYRKRQLESCKRFGLEVGPFFVLASGTRVRYFELVLGYSINLLISL